MLDGLLCEVSGSDAGRRLEVAALARGDVVVPYGDGRERHRPGVVGGVGLVRGAGDRHLGFFDGDSATRRHACRFG